MKFSLSVVILFVLLSCNQIQHHDIQYNNKQKCDTLLLKFAKGFRIVDHKNYKELCIFNPWQGASNIAINYILTDHPEHVPAGIRGVVIRTPVNRIVCLSTTYIAMIDILHETSSIVGISGAGLMYNKAVSEKINKGEISDVGYEQSLNYELILGLKPDLVMAYGLKNVTGYLKKLEELGVKVVLNAEYLESDPLAKAEWIKYIAAFYNKESLAISIFDTVSEAYSQFRAMAQNITFRPTVMSGLPWNNTWYVGGGKSYAARLIEDAGGSYLWKNDTSHESLPLSVESVFVTARNADFWINTGAAKNTNEILAVDKRLSGLKPFREGRLYNNNAIISTGGGSDYWESGVMNPHLILKDMISIFHPDLFPGTKLFYYKKI